MRASVIVAAVFLGTNVCAIPLQADPYGLTMSPNKHDDNDAPDEHTLAGLVERFTHIKSDEVLRQEWCWHLVKDLADYETARGKDANPVHVRAIEDMQNLAECHRVRHHKLLNHHGERSQYSSAQRRTPTEEGKVAEDTLQGRHDEIEWSPSNYAKVLGSIWR